MREADYIFRLTDLQKYAIRDVAVSMSELCFTGSGVVKAIVWEEYEVFSYIFREDGSIVKESRGLDSEGWLTEERDSDGVWRTELEMVNG